MPAPQLMDTPTIDAESLTDLGRPHEIVDIHLAAHPMNGSQAE
jgi:hypothetical protein